MRKLGKGLVVVGLIVGGLLVVVQVGLGPLVARRLRHVLPKITGTPSTVDAVRLSLFTGLGEIRGLTVANPPGFTEPEAFRLDRAHVSVAPLSLFGSPVVVHEVLVDGAEICYERGPDGRDNLAILRGGLARTPVPADTNAAAPPASKPAAPERRYIVDSLTITNCRVRLAAGVLTTNAMEVAVPPIAVHDLGRDAGGLTARELSGELMRALTASAVQAAAGSPDVQNGLFQALLKAIDKHKKKKTPPAAPAPAAP